MLRPSVVVIYLILCAVIAMTSVFVNLEYLSVGNLPYHYHYYDNNHNNKIGNNGIVSASASTPRMTTTTTDGAMVRLDAATLAAFGCGGVGGEDPAECLKRVARDHTAVSEAFGCHDNHNDNDNGDSGGGSSCWGRIARDRSARNLAQGVHRENRQAAARERAASSAAGGGGRMEKDDAAAMPQNHPAYRDFLPPAEWTNTNAAAAATGLAYANIEIAGLPKAGTSHLYSVLTNRPDTFPLNPKLKKEFCPKTAKTPEQFHRWHDKLYRQNLARNDTGADIPAANGAAGGGTKKLSVNGCIRAVDHTRRHGYLWGQQNQQQQQHPQKYVVLFRDPADWMWAVWNFWTNRADVIENPPSNWAKTGSNYRSPELFHEMWLSGPGVSKWFAHSLTQFRILSVERILRLRETVGRERILMLKNEDLRPSRASAPGGVLDRLSAFTGLDRSLYDESVVGATTNCNDKKGSHRACDDNENDNDTESSSSSSSSSSYGISGNRTMLPETRELIYLYFWEECKIWSEEFGVHYEDCVNVLPSSSSLS